MRSRTGTDEYFLMGNVIKIMNTFITKQELKKRGWTEGAIIKFLGEPDQLKKNPHHATGPSMQLFNLARVEEHELSKSFISWKEKTELSRKQARARALEHAQRKREELQDYIDKLEIDIPKMKRDQLVCLAVDHYNDLHMARGNYDKCATKNDDLSFIARITANMLRHHFSDYENELNRLFGKVGREEGYIRLRQRVMNRIYEVYPWIKRHYPAEPE